MAAADKATNALDYDAIIIGAGISGMYQLLKLRELGLSVRVFEEGDGVGGTWYWNRYPGARFDSESWSYGYSFSKELLEEWDWKEKFSPQPDTLEYLNYVADKFDLKRDIQFSSPVEASKFDDASQTWSVRLGDGAEYRSRYLITAVGPLSRPTMPNIEGRDEFEGEAFHTARWPKTPVSFENKRVAVIGTGATGVQTIQEVAKTAGSLTVFQRRPNWCAPLHNGKITPEEQAEIKATYEETFARCRETQSCFLHMVDPRNTFDVTDEEREAFFEQRYSSPGFGMWQGNFKDMMVNREANAAVSDFVARKIRGRVKDPEIAEMLIPKDHGFGTRRVPLETKYYEVYNQANVHLVDIMANPIERITARGLETTAEAYDFDMIIFATGFDAITGSLYRIDIEGADGVGLKERWADGIETFLGMQIDGFPNMFMLVGPHTALGNIPRSIEYAVEWVTDLIQHMEENRLATAEVRAEAVRDWTDFVIHTNDGLLSNEVDSWMTGVNRNVAGKETRSLSRYSGTAPEFRKRADAIAAAGYKEIRFT